MREQEFGWEPPGPGMVTELQASLDADNRIVSWNHEVWSNTRSNRPVGAGGVLVGGEVIPGFPAPEPKPIPTPDGDGSQTSNPL
jgi:nicotinate dehydrogenase subunit B